MVSQLIGYIGLRSVSSDVPTSGVYINELPGITTRQFTDVRSEEITDIEDEWDELESRAIRSFEVNIRKNLKKYFKNYNLVNTEASGYIDDNDIVDHGSGVYSGLYLDLYPQSENLKIVFNSVKLNLTSGQSFNVKIFDANTGKELFTKAVTGVAGLQTVKILQEFSLFDYNRLFICYDTAEPYKIYEMPSGVSSYGANVSTSSSVISDNISGGETGLIVDFSLKCGIDAFVAQRLELFQESFLYKLGLEFLKTSKYSEKMNRFTMLDSERRDQMIEDFEMNYKNSLDSVFEDLIVPDDGICFICNKSITQKVLIP